MDSLAYVLARAVKNLYRDIEIITFGITKTNTAFVDLSNANISGKDFQKIETEMGRLIGSNLSFDLKPLSPTEKKYKEYFETTAKVTKTVSNEELNDIHFSIAFVSGVYFKNDKNETQLKRIECVFANSKAGLDARLEKYKNVSVEDHRAIGKRQDLFVFSNLVGKGLPLYTEKGAALKRVLERFIVDEEIKRGYIHVDTPELANIELYKKSGHYPYYKDSMYSPIDIDGDGYLLRPMTCPHHFELYLSKPRSYKELPIRYAEIAKLFRYEKSGELLGLTRVRSFCLSDAHIICADVDQAKEEISKVLDFVESVNKKFGFELTKDYWYRLSVSSDEKGEKYFDDAKAWKTSEKILRDILTERKVNFDEKKDEAAFYGPKIDIQMKSITGKEDTAFTVQYDFVMPKRFNLKYVGKDGKEHEPIIIHRSSIGAIERLMAFLIEKYKGRFPFWLSPIQAKIISVNDTSNGYAEEVFNYLLQNQVRVRLDVSSSKLGEKIYKAKKEFVNHLIILGLKDEENKTITLEERDGVKKILKKEEYIKLFKQLNV